MSNGTNIHPLWGRERLTLAEYRRLHRDVPDASRPLVVKNRLNSLKARQAELKHRGVDVELLFEVLRSNAVDPDTQEIRGSSVERQIDELSLQMLQAIEQDVCTRRQSSGAYARTGAVLPDNLINEFALALAEHVHSDGLELPVGLLSLLQVRLDPDLANPSYRSSMEEKRAQAVVAVARDPSISTRELAAEANIDQSTASRWQNEPKFQRQVEQIRRDPKLLTKRPRRK